MGIISGKLFVMLGVLLIVGYFVTTLPYLVDGQKRDVYIPFSSKLIDDSKLVLIGEGNCGILGCTVDNFFNGVGRIIIIIINSIGMIIGSILGIGIVFQILPSGFGIVLSLIVMIIIIGIVKIVWSGE
jgi:hypothetical protein